MAALARPVLFVAIPVVSPLVCRFRVPPRYVAAALKRRMRMVLKVKAGASRPRGRILRSQPLGNLLDLLGRAIQRAVESQLRAHA